MFISARVVTAAPMSGHRNALSMGHRLHCYEIESVLGQGGFGITYLAHDTNLGQQVALKEYLPSDLVTRTRDSAVYPLLDDHLDTFGWGLNRFLGDARTLATFSHPNIVRVLAVFEANNTAYRVMEYERGRSLEDALEFGSIGLDETSLRGLLTPLLEGLEQMHAAGVIHRDIKPSNIMLRGTDDDGAPVPVLVDFGSGRQAPSGDESRTLTAPVTPGYAPFEQHNTSSERDQDQQGPWTDIYSLAATLYRVVTGKAPEEAMSRVDPAMRGEDVLEPASRVAAGRYSTEFLAAIDSGLALMPVDRPQTVARWRDMFDGKTPATGLVHVGTDTMMAKPTTAPVSAKGDSSRSSRRLLVPLLVVCVLLGAVAAGVWWKRGGDGPSPVASEATTAGDTAMTSSAADGGNPTGDSTSTADAADAAQTAALQAEEEAQRQADIVRQQAAEEAQRQTDVARQQAAKEAQRQADIARQQAADEAQRQADIVRQQAAEEAQRQTDVPRQQAAEEAQRQAEAEQQTANDTELDAARRERVSTLLAEADADIAATRLSSPPGRNALERLREVQTLDPGNSEVARALGRIEASYLELVDRAIAAGKFALAETFATRLANITPDSEASLEARKRIEAARRP